MSEKNLILEKIQSNKDEYLNFLKELIQTDSYNPPGNEKNVALIIKKYLESIDVKCEINPFGNNRANLIALLNENLSGKNLLFNGHMDVVPPGNEKEWKYPPLSGKSTKKKIFGRGTADMKGALAAMVIAFKILKELGYKLSGNLILNAVADEETGGKLGSYWSIDNILKARGIKSDFAIIGEPTGLDPLPKSIVLGEKGKIVVKIITNGISCHSSAPFIGKNAITMMSKIINNLYKLEENLNEIVQITPPLTQDELKQLIIQVFPNKQMFDTILEKNPLLQGIIRSLSEFTSSLNMIKGGIKDNVIPDTCEAVIDIRLLPGQTPEITMQALKMIITDLGYEIRDSPIGDVDDIFIYLEIIRSREASYWNEWRESKSLKDLFIIVEEVYKKKPFYFLFPASADSHYFRNSDYCPQTVLFGPGNAMSAHSTDEYIEIQDFFNAIEVYARFALDFLT